MTARRGTTKVLLPFILLLLTAACGDVQRPYPIEYQEGSRPPIGSRSTAVVGDVVYGEYKVTGYEGAEIEAPIKWKGGAFNNLSVDVPAGTVLVRYTVDEGDAYCSGQRLVFEALEGPWRPLCLRDRNSDGRFETLTWLGGITPSDLAPPVPYRTVPVPIHRSAGMRQELSFSGIDGDTLRFSYREYTGDLAKPAFQQDLTYGYGGPGTSIRFRGVEIVVHAVSNDGLDYTVEAGF